MMFAYSLGACSIARTDKVESRIWGDEKSLDTRWQRATASANSASEQSETGNSVSESLFPRRRV